MEILMRVLVVLVVCASSLTLGTAQDENLNMLAQQAGEHYRQGDYAAARSIYEMLLEAGGKDSAIYYNLGQTYFELQDMGRALVNYRRAQLLAPRDLDLIAAIERVREARVDILGDETHLMDNLASLTAGLLTIEEFDWVMFGLWITLCSLIGWFVIGPRWQPLLRGLLLIVGSVLIVALILWICRHYVNARRPAGVVVEDVVSVMSGPGDDYLAIYDLHAAAEVRLLERRAGWAHFILPDGREGWIRLETIEMV